MIQFRVKRLVYGTADPKGGAVDSVLDLVRHGFNHRLEVDSGVLEENVGACSSAFSESCAGSLKRIHSNKKERAAG